MTTPLGKKTFAEYKKAIRDTKVELENLSKAKRVEFSITQEMQSLADDLQNEIKESDVVISKSNNLVQEVTNILDRAQGEMNDLLNRAEKLAGDLRLLQSQANKLETEATKASNDLGVREEDLPGFDDMVDLAGMADDNIGYLEDSISAMDRLIQNL